jgi:HAD superfamily phosphatase (TIGR01668 family)
MERVKNFATPLDLKFVHQARKPRNAPFRKAMSMLGLSGQETIVVGDQMMTDVYGGNRMGLFTVLVLPISIADEGWGTRINRRLEKIALKRLRKKGLWLEEEKHQ